jgi:hypothetical protein
MKGCDVGHEATENIVYNLTQTFTEAIFVGAYCNFLRNQGKFKRKVSPATKLISRLNCCVLCKLSWLFVAE